MPQTLNYTDAALRVCVDRAEGGQIQGRMVGRRLTGPVPFGDVGSLLLQAEAVMDAQNFPQAFQRGRSFVARSAGAPAAQRPEEGMPRQAVEGAEGAEATFVLHVDTRQRATWQGTVDWLDGGAPQPFESVLELLKLIDQRFFPGGSAPGGRR